MKNRIKKHGSSFTTFTNNFLRDSNLSFKAKGLFCYMMSMSDDWNFTIKSIASQQKDGEASVISALNELKENHYVEYEKHNDGTGTYHFFNVPKLENPNLGNPNLGKPQRIKKEQLDKKEQIKKTLNKNISIPTQIKKKKLLKEKKQRGSKIIKTTENEIWVEEAGNIQIRPRYTTRKGGIN